MSSESKRERLIEELERKNGIAIAIEIVIFFIIIGGIFTALIVYTREHHWTGKGAPILVTLAVLGTLTTWLVFRTVAGLPPLTADDRYFEQKADEILGSRSGTDDTDS